MAQAVSPDYVRARWAYSELLSKSVGHYYKGLAVQELKDKSIQGILFDTLTQENVRVLVHEFNSVRGRFFDRYPVTGFELTHWTREELGGLCVVPDLSDRLQSFGQWVVTPPILGERDPRHELRNAAPFVQNDPLTIGRRAGDLYLIDGYHRACWFWGTNDASSKLAVFLPTSGFKGPAQTVAR